MAVVGPGNVVSPPLSPRQVKLGRQYLAGAIGLPLRPPTSFLAAGPIKGTVHKLGPFHQIRTNVENGDLLAAAVVATASATGRSVVFHDGGAPLSTTFAEESTTSRRS